MNTSNIKNYAPKARKDFIAAITKQAARYGISEDAIAPMEIKGDLAIIGGVDSRPFSAAIAKTRDELVKKVEQFGFTQTIEQVAYSWFNRLCAIRYMELHDYLDHGRRVLSHPEHATGYQILDDCLEIELPGLDQHRVRKLKLDGTQDETLYRELLLAQCHSLHKAMPFLFETIDDETELLLPENLTKTDSLIHDLITEIPEEDWQSVEIVGWLYQFYISEKKDQVIGKVVRSEDIPAATQLFTPNWIVKYMVQNSLGAQWLATYPDSPLKAQMEYYIEPAEQTDEVNGQLKAITPEDLNPEELTLIDPACGSGHILVEAYDLFKAIYLERGYRQRDIAQLILEKNLFGLDIDGRAAQLTGFALMMKGREDDRRLFDRGVKLNVMALQDSRELDVESLHLVLPLENFGLETSDLIELNELFEYSTTFGSLIKVQKGLAEKLPAITELVAIEHDDWLIKDALQYLAVMVKQAEILAVQYDAVVANPPYMGGKYLNPALKKFLKDNYKGYEKDVFSAFIDRGLAFSKPRGRLGFMSPFVWMFISSHECLRTRIIDSETITSLVQLEYSGFDGATVPICTFTLQKGHVNGQKGGYIRLSDFRGADNQGPKTLEAINRRNCGWFFEIAQDEFKKIPGSPVAYWVSKKITDIYVASPKASDVSKAAVGLQTGDNDKFMRYWYEVDQDLYFDEFKSTDETLNSSIKWVPYNKGGAYRKWYGNREFVVNWLGDGKDIKEIKPKSVVRSPDLYFQESVTWSEITSSWKSFRFNESGSISDVKGQSAYYSSNKQLISALCWLNSNVVEFLTKVQNPTLSFQSGDYKNLPLPVLDNCVVPLGESAISICKKDWDAFENSNRFLSNSLLCLNDTVETSLDAYTAESREKTIKLQSIEEEINEVVVSKFELQSDIRVNVFPEQVTLKANPAYRYGNTGTEEERNTRFREDTIAELVSYVIGCMMGRYSLDESGLIYAHSGNEGFDANRYPTFPADDDGIIPLTDKEWFFDDAANRLVEFVSVAWPKESLEENLQFLAANFSPKKGEDSRDTLRRYLCDKFFKDHMQTYKKRPIYWLFSSGKQKAFQCLVYLHRYNEGTLARMRTEYVIPLTAKLSTHVSKLEKDVEASSSTAEIKKLEKEIAKLHKQQTELSTFDEKLRHYADQRISLDLDDGVKVNYGKFGDLLAEVKAITGKAPA